MVARLNSFDNPAVNAADLHVHFGAFRDQVAKALGDQDVRISALESRMNEAFEKNVALEKRLDEAATRFVDHGDRLKALDDSSAAAREVDRDAANKRAAAYTAAAAAGDNKPPLASPGDPRNELEWTKRDRDNKPPLASLGDRNPADYNRNPADYNRNPASPGGALAGYDKAHPAPTAPVGSPAGYDKAHPAPSGGPGSHVGYDESHPPATTPSPSSKPPAPNRES